MIGFYDYTVVLTYISFTSSIIGIFLCCYRTSKVGCVLSGAFRIMRYV